LESKQWTLHNWTEIANILLTASEAQQDKVRDIVAKITESAEIEGKVFKLLASVV